MGCGGGRVIGVGVEEVLRGKKEKAFFCPGPGAGKEETPGVGGRPAL